MKKKIKDITFHYTNEQMVRFNRNYYDKWFGFRRREW